MLRCRYTDIDKELGASVSSLLVHFLINCRNFMSEQATREECSPTLAELYDLIAAVFVFLTWDHRGMQCNDDVGRVNCFAVSVRLRQPRGAGVPTACTGDITYHDAQAQCWLLTSTDTLRPSFLPPHCGYVW